MSRKIIVRNDELRLVEGIIYAPYQLDTWGTMMLPEDIAKMAYDFSVKRMSHSVDHEHNEIASGCEILRHWLALKNDPDGYPEGAWIGVTKIHNDDMWEMVKRGDINGYSVHCYASEVPFTGIVNRVTRASGTTEQSTDNVLLPPHAHDLILDFDASGQVVITRTSEVLGHRHSVYYATATEKVFDHCHPIKISGEN